MFIFSKTMFPYRVKHTESEYDIQINELLYKIDHQCQNAFEFFWNFSKTFKHSNFLFCVIFKLHNPYFVIFVNFVILGFLYFYIHVFFPWDKQKVNCHIYIYIYVCIYIYKYLFTYIFPKQSLP